MICILHGYLLDGSGSNLWTRSIVQSLCRNGETIHLVCQENHPDWYDFIAEAFFYRTDDSIEIMCRREVPYKGRCIMHKPQLGNTLPVFVWDRYEEFTNVVPMIELSDTAIEDYLRRNAEVVTHIVRSFDISAIHANHAVLISVVAQRVGAATSIPFTIMPHGSDIEYAVKKDYRFLKLATGAFTAAKRIFVPGPEMRDRVKDLFTSVPDLDAKMTELRLGVDTSLFEPIPRSLRIKNVDRLLGTIADVPRGKTPELSEIMIRSLSEEMTEQELRSAIRSASSYEAKQPDASVETRLKAIDWGNDDILVFVGRIIASKGLQSILTALPLILNRRPSARLLVVGHGPLREAMEALLWALQHGRRSLVERIVEWGSSLEGGGPRAFESIRSFYGQLDQRRELDAYYSEAKQYLSDDRIIFTGYLTHDKLRYLFPCCDVAVFPSIVAEAGPLVFLEALASGCFPLGTYFAGMAANIDTIAASLSPEHAELMKLSASEDDTVTDIVTKVPLALQLRNEHRERFRELVVENYDWKNVANKLASELASLSQ